MALRIKKSALDFQIMLFELDQFLARAKDWSELRCNPQLEEQTIGFSLDADSVLEARSIRPCPHLKQLCLTMKLALIQRPYYIQK